MTISYSKLTYDELFAFLSLSGEYLKPVKLHELVDLKQYTSKICDFAEHISCLNGDVLIGLIACYMNSSDAFITYIGVHPEHFGKGISQYLLNSCRVLAAEKGCLNIIAEVNIKNIASQKGFSKSGYIVHDKKGDSLFYKLVLV